MITGADQPRVEMTFGRKLRGIAELGRVSNVPTTVSNVLVGAALARMQGELDPARVVVTIVAVALLYVGGMAMNDTMDARIDMEQRPNRPIPAGRVSLGEAQATVALTLGTALALLGYTGLSALLWGLALTGSMVLYNAAHKRFPQMVFVMGACRGLVYVTAAKAIAPDLAVENTLWPALGLTIYVAILTYVARSETGPKVGARKWLALLMPLVVVPATIHFGLPVAIVPLVVFGTLMVGFQVRAMRFLFSDPPRTMHTIMTWIAGISMVDAYFAAMLGQWPFALGSVAFAALTTWGHRHILGT